MSRDSDLRNQPDSDAMKPEPDKVHGAGKRDAEKTGSDEHELPSKEQKSYGADRSKRPRKIVGFGDHREFAFGKGFSGWK